MTVAAPELRDAVARRRIREDLATTLFVEAAAGTGKTTALVARILAVLRAGLGTLDRVVALTFTEKAAGEMKLRLRGELERERVDPSTPAVERARLEAALAHLEVARIGTIHAYCADLLHERPVEAGVDPLFEVAPEDEAQALLDQAFESWFQRILADPPEGVRRVLRRRPRGMDDEGPRGALRAAAGALAEHRDFPAAYRREPFGRDASIDELMAVLERLAPRARLAHRPDDDWLAKNLQTVARFVEETELRERVRGRDYDGLEAELRDLVRAKGWHWIGGRSEYAPGLERAQVVAERDAAKRALDDFRARADADVAACLREELRPVVEAYEAAKRRAGRLDFLDLLLYARDLVRDDQRTRAELQQRYTHFFVDEFQDTDPLQAELLLLLAADDPAVRDAAAARPLPGKLFIVGDPKQSIYRFRRADIALYEATKRRLVAAGAEVVHLTTSFRGAPAIQEAVNAVFAPLMRGGEEGIQADYAPLHPFRADPPGRPAVVALPVPRPYSDFGRLTHFKVEESLPDAVGAFVAWLVGQSGWMVTERDRPGVAVPVESRHVCILFRRFRSFREDTTRRYVRALEARRIPHVLVGGRSYHDREEVLALRNALVAIEWPDDALRVFATLRGPFFALGDDALLAFRSTVGSLHPLRRLTAEERAALLPAELEVADALALLAELHVARNRRPIAETIVRLLGALRAHAGIANWPTGEQALANCLRLVDRARRFERRGAPSFRAFVDRLEREAERGEGEEAPIVEEGTEGVRIMTVHKAKGLEFPVVILADPTCRAVREPPSHHVDPERGLWAEPLAGAAPWDLLDAHDLEMGRERAEAVRVAYVAATRARDLLVVPVVGDQVSEDEKDGWLDALRPAVYPAGADRRHPRPAAGTPPFGQDSVLAGERPPEAGFGTTGSVAPGLHTAAAGSEVVWWDPATLDLDRDEAVGLRQQRLLEADESGVVAEGAVRAHDAWQQERSAVLVRGAAPSLRVETVTARAAASAATPGAGRDSGAAGPPAARGGASRRPAPPAASAEPPRQLSLLPGADEPVAEPAAPEAVPTPAAEPSTTAAEIPLPAPPEEPVEVVALGPPGGAGRPHGTRFGALVHAALAAVALDDPASGVRRIVEAQARLLAASAEEIDAATSAVERVLTHPLLRRAAAAGARGELRRESPIALRQADGSLLEGNVDLAFRETDESGRPLWTVVDFKTDRELAGRRPVYEEQVRLYARAVAAATGEPARGLLVVL